MAPVVWANVPIPGSYPDLYNNYGNPASPDFEKTYIVSTEHAIADGSNVTVRCHVAIADRLHQVWAALRAKGHINLVKSYDGCYVYRDIRGEAHLSIHAWGLAIDLNAAHFPLGSLNRQDPSLVQAFAAQGFISGADFYGRKDPMHFELCKLHTI